MLYTRKIIEDLIKSIKREIHRTNLIIVINDKNKIVRDGRFVSVNKKYLKIQNERYGVHKILIRDINNISVVVTQ